MDKKSKETPAAEQPQEQEQPKAEQSPQKSAKVKKTAEFSVVVGSRVYEPGDTLPDDIAPESLASLKKKKVV